MTRAYIYLISFEGKNDIYIGKTILHNIYCRLKQHRCNSKSSVYQFVEEKLNNDWSKVSIDIIDSIDMNEDLTYLLTHPLNSKNEKQPFMKKYTFRYESQISLAYHKLAYTEFFHIHNYKNDTNYNFINKSIISQYFVYDIYKFLYYTKK
jgi:hypothetical protein